MTTFPGEEGVDVLQRVVAREASDGPLNRHRVAPVPAEIRQVRVNVRRGRWWWRQGDRSGFQKSHLPGRESRFLVGQQGREECADVDRFRAAAGGGVLVQDFERRQETFSFEDLLSQMFLAFLYFIEGDCHALQDKQLQC